jgi:hypothetical protein
LTPESHLLAEITVVGGGPGPKGQDRKQWTVNWQQSAVIDRQLTDLGHERQTQRHQSRQFVDAWIVKVARRNHEDAFLDHLEPARRPQMAKEYAARLMAAGLAWCAGSHFGHPGAAVAEALPLLDPVAARRIFLPGFDSLQGTVTFDDTKVRHDGEDTLKITKIGMTNLFLQPNNAHPLMLILPTEPSMLPWSLTADGRVQFTHTCQFGLSPHHRCEAWITVEADPKDPTGWRYVKMRAVSAGDKEREGKMQMRELP